MDVIFAVAQDQPPPAGASTNPVLNAITWAGEHFIGLFNEAGKQFAGLITGILPTLIALLTFMYAMIAFIGEDRVTRAIQIGPMDDHSVHAHAGPGDARADQPDGLHVRPLPAGAAQAGLLRLRPVSFAHPVTTFFPYANAGELFVWLGVAAGVTKLGESPVPLAIRYFLVGIVVIFIRGVCTELITGYLIRREGKAELFDRFDAEYAAAAAGGAK